MLARIIAISLVAIAGCPTLDQPLELKFTGPSGTLTEVQAPEFEAVVMQNTTSQEVVRVDFAQVRKDGSQVDYFDDTPPFSMRWYVKGSQNGDHLWLASATTADGKVYHSRDSIKVTVDISAEADRERYVHLAGGSCMGELELEVGGASHPSFPRVATDACLKMDQSTATTSLRVRCVDPSGRLTSSDWVGPATPGNADTDLSLCANILN